MEITWEESRVRSKQRGDDMRRKQSNVDMMLEEDEVKSIHRGDDMGRKQGKI